MKSFTPSAGLGSRSVPVPAASGTTEAASGLPGLLDVPPLDSPPALTGRGHFSEPLPKQRLLDRLDALEMKEKALRTKLRLQGKRP